MNHLHNDKTLPIAAGIKAAVLVSVLGFIVLIADQSLILPAEVPVTGAGSSVAPYEATSMSADGRGYAPMVLSTAAQGDGAEHRVAARAPGLYPELARDALHEENGHPASF